MTTTTMPGEQKVTMKPLTSMIKLPTETTTIVDVCSNTQNCHIITGTTATGMITTCTTNGKAETIQPASDKTITKFTITTFTQTITIIYPGYETTITTSSNGILMTYTTYYQPSTVIALQPVTATVPVEDAIIASNGIGTKFKDNNGLIGIVLSLWIVMWSLVYMSKFY
ncbi:5942_t:CDS:2 [Cetraspora pellucida]|uniref:5942_t:CDS:1 n=1 Tax=Cetraspora pellucida TaxID=1433469 RepID=A0A9N9H521_9GLOM|nr:5942_t:CDS:2 [Cetraspora pellucida]